jgi:hemoglobin
MIIGLRTLRRSAIGSILLLLTGAGAGWAQTSGQATLYERLGGLPAIALVIDDFVDDFIRDPTILANPAVRERKTPDAAPYIKFQVTSLVCQLSGGPCEYAGMDMREAHAGLDVSAGEWDRMVVIFAETLERHGVPEPEQQEIFAILGPARDDIVVSAP